MSGDPRLAALEALIAKDPDGFRRLMKSAAGVDSINERISPHERVVLRQWAEAGMFDGRQGGEAPAPAAP